MGRKVIVIQHNPWEGPGQFLLGAAKKYTIKMDIIRVWEEKIPEIKGYAAMIVLGGGPNVDQEHLYPFLTEEKQTIKKAIARDIPYLGFCLGHQLLADVLGAKVGPNFQSSLGYIQGFLTHAGKSHPVFKGLPQNMPFFKWHSQAVQEPLPGHVAILATSAECQVEAISLQGRPHILGLQFDNHAAAPENVKNWITMDSKWLATIQDRVVNTAMLLEDARKHQETIRMQFTKLFDNFFSLVQ
ncbi:MAG: glutamine amidotransferase [Desulfobacterales bacterium SG8_35]|nr:MAG: glutamine amidotransferase [Desulfobacterales bacterium SG8_35]